MTEPQDSQNELHALQERIREQERELLRERDRVIGLEAEIKQLADGHLVEELRSQLSNIESSNTYRAGLVVMAPIRFVARVFTALRRRILGVVSRSRERLDAR